MRLDETLNAGSGVHFEGTLIDALQTPYQLIEVFDTILKSGAMLIRDLRMRKNFLIIVTHHLEMSLREYSALSKKDSLYLLS